MIKAVRMGIWAGLIVAISGVAAQACQLKTVAEGTRVIDPYSIDQRLMDKVIHAQLNYTRCKLGLPSLKQEPRLKPIAEGHSRWMARKQKVVHNAGRNTLRRRLDKSGVAWKTGAENIVKTALYKIEIPQGYRVVDSARCQFATRSGQKIARHTYNSVASYAMKLWMNSPGHREHIMNPRLKVAGVGAAYDSKVAHCGVLYITQNFVG